MEKQTMKVMYRGKKLEVETTPVWRENSWWFWGGDYGEFVACNTCTPVPAETDLERARRLVNEAIGNGDPYPDEAIIAYESAISRLTAERGTEEEAIAYANYIVLSHECGQGVLVARLWLAARRKEKEGA